MPPKPTPTATLKLRGTYRKDRHGDRENEPQPEGEMAPPDDLDDAALANWHRLAPLVADVATNWDAEAFAGLCRWLAVFDSSMRKMERGYPDQTLQRMASQAWGHCEKGLAAFGMTPSARTQVRVKASKQAKGFQPRKRG